VQHTTSEKGGDLIAALRRMGLADATASLRLTPLTGGVASDIVRVDGAGAPFVVKRALEKLRVKADWHAPVERNAYEVAWLKAAARAVPGAAPPILGEDRESGLFAMAYLPADTHPVWKTELLAGRVDPAFAAMVGERLGAIHRATAGDAAVAARFDTLHIFRPIRLDAYLGATAERHPALAQALIGLAERTAATRLALVHGDVSPKNILVGPHGPVFLDAECAWYGDPAFDLAFCLNHLLLKGIVRPDRAAALLGSFDALAGAYRRRVVWEPRDGLEERAAALLAALLLARIDGKSPVEYITRDEDKSRVRRIAIPYVAEPPRHLSILREAWASELGG
jgi:aminoglycoside phosphotransferase (APT) family kinase protein